MIILYTDHRKKMVQEYKVIYRNSFKIWLDYIYINVYIYINMYIYMYIYICIYKMESLLYT